MLPKASSQTVLEADSRGCGRIKPKTRTAAHHEIFKRVPIDEEFEIVLYNIGIVHYILCSVMSRV